MATLVKTVQVNLTPTDVIRTLLSFTKEDWHRLQTEASRISVEEGVEISHWFNFPLPSELSDLSDLPTAPPPTPSGDREALAAAEELFRLFDDIDPELARWGASSEQIGQAKKVAQPRTYLSCGAG